MKANSLSKFYLHVYTLTTSNVNTDKLHDARKRL